MVEQICFKEALLEGTKEIFETMIFMDIQESSEPGESIEGDALLGSITFSGDIDGCLGLQFSKVCAQTIAKNMLGMEPEEEISEEEINDAIGEVANMVMGSVKSRLQDNIKNINVSIPTVVGGQKIKQYLGDESRGTSINVNIEDEHTAVLSLSYKENSE